IALICSVLRFMRTGKAERRPEKSRESSKGLAKADSNYGGIVEQTDVLLNGNDIGHREHLLTFVGPDLVAARWKQFRAYFADVAPGRSGGGGATLLGGVGSSAAPMNGYPKVFNIEADPREGHNIGEKYDGVVGPLLKAG